MVDYKRFLRGALELCRDRPSVLGEELDMRSWMLIISRADTRELLNLEEMAAAVMEIGFNVTVVKTSADVLAMMGRRRCGEWGRRRRVRVRRRHGEWGRRRRCGEWWWWR
ncbi:hypothetical protein GUJ93_ZPchr0012g19539 [Zizania palustris]|uniref:Uncharacterized protein n=1 Tax=Zizania palustris TaxID=103762 RepID=A0A8J5WTW2_ZIZPA|nr:hypothetical protein GUJ93_ZPchr0012g19539 [Zizania palustris]